MEKKEIRYHLKNDVCDDLDFLRCQIDYLLSGNDIGFEFIPSYSILPAFFRVFSHLLFNRTFETWFNKVYD